jgi:hypothetical protein
MTHTKSQQKAIALKTMAMKSRAYNQIKVLFDEKHANSKLSPEKKLELIAQAMNESRWELRFYKQKREGKAKIQEAREKRGWKPKKKTTKAQWEEMQNQKQPA